MKGKAEYDRAERFSLCMKQTISCISNGYTEKGNANKNKRVLLCLHGFGGDKDSSVIRNLGHCLKENGLDIFSYDWPAHGESPVEGSELNIENCLSYLKSITAVLQRAYEEVNCFATSFGGYLATLFRNENPDVFQRTVLRSPALRMDEIFRTLVGEKSFGRLLAGDNLELGFERKMMLDKSFYDGLTMNNAFDPIVKYPERILILQGDMDDVVPPEDTRLYAEKNRIVVEWFNGTDHRYKKPGEMEHILSATKGFLLQGDNVL